MYAALMARSLRVSKMAGDLEMRLGFQIYTISSSEKISCSPSGAQPSSSR